MCSSIHAGVYLSLNGIFLTNNSNILITDIGTPLVCTTDSIPCCRGANRNGEWLFPNNGGQVPTLNEATSFYRNRGDSGEVNLFRLNSDVMAPTGQFCCEVPDATGIDNTVCANIGELYKCKLSILYACTP